MRGTASFYGKVQRLETRERSSRCCLWTEPSTRLNDERPRSCRGGHVRLAYGVYLHISLAHSGQSCSGPYGVSSSASAM